MKTKHCIGCLKTLPADFAGELCSLCGIGFVPNTAATRNSAQVSDNVSARNSSGTRCPYCSSALQYRDLNIGACSVCGGELDKDGGARGPNERAATPDLMNLRSNSIVVPPRSGAGEIAWPEDAPLW
jgi:rRNA maturation endonuclease Nob1